MVLLDGKRVAEKTRLEIANGVNEFVAKHGRAPGLTVVRVGEDPASHVYVNAKLKACREVGMESQEIHLPESVSQSDLMQTITELNTNALVDGVLIQLPLPAHLDSRKVISALSPTKDADALTSMRMGELVEGSGTVVSCTPAGIMKILKDYSISLDGKNAVVIGRSLIVGKPVSLLLLAQNATVTVCHSRTKNLKDWVKQADIVVVAIGKPHFLSAKDFKKGAVVVDVGIHRTDKGLVGDVNPEGAEGHLEARTPVPGGVGPMTIAMLLANTLNLAQARNQ